MTIKGVQFIVDENGAKTAVVIDLKRHGTLWEDFYDGAIALARANEPRESFDALKKRLRSQGKLKNGA